MPYEKAMGDIGLIFTDALTKLLKKNQSSSNATISLKDQKNASLTQTRAAKKLP